MARSSMRIDLLGRRPIVTAGCLAWVEHSDRQGARDGKVVNAYNSQGTTANRDAKISLLHGTLDVLRRLWWRGHQCTWAPWGAGQSWQPGVLHAWNARSDEALVTARPSMRKDFLEWYWRSFEPAVPLDPTIQGSHACQDQQPGSYHSSQCAGNASTQVTGVRTREDWSMPGLDSARVSPWATRQRAMSCIVSIRTSVLPR